MIKEYVESEPDSLFEPEAIKRKVMEKIDIKNLDPRIALKVAIPCMMGIVLIWFGLTTTGSYFEQASRFGGLLSTIWYGWQLGNFLAMIGTVLIYDSIKRTGYL
jgi:hypothetical protein